MADIFLEPTIASNLYVPWTSALLNRMGPLANGLDCCESNCISVLHFCSNGSQHNRQLFWEDSECGQSLMRFCCKDKLSLLEI